MGDDKENKTNGWGSGIEKLTEDELKKAFSHLKPDSHEVIQAPTPKQESPEAIAARQEAIDKINAQFASNMKATPNQAPLKLNDALKAATRDMAANLQKHISPTPQTTLDKDNSEQRTKHTDKNRSSSSSLDSSQSSTNSAPARLEGNSDNAKKGNTRKKLSKKSKRKASRKEAVKKEIETRSRAQSDPISVAPKIASQRSRSESNPINPTRNENSMAGSGGISKRGNISAMVASTRKLIDGVNTKWATKSKAEKASTTQNNGRTR
jgi:hypothetical protein